VKDHYLSEETLPINQIASMILRSGQFGSVPMSIDEFYQAVCVVNQENKVEDESKEEEKKETSGIEVNPTVKTSKIDLAKLKKFITG
jgi:hypothetical protein